MHRTVPARPHVHASRSASRSGLEDLSLFAWTVELAFVVTVLLVTALTGLHG